MSAQDFFYYSVGLGFIILTIVLVGIGYSLLRILTQIRRLTKIAGNTVANIENTTKEVRMIKDRIELGFWETLSMFLNLIFKKGGEKYGR